MVSDALSTLGLIGERIMPPITDRGPQRTRRPFDDTRCDLRFTVSGSAFQNAAVRTAGLQPLADLPEGTGRGTLGAASALHIAEGRVRARTTPTGSSSGENRCE